MSDIIYNCPGCLQDFTKDQKQGKFCPCGEIELKAQKVKVVGEAGFHYEYIAANPESPAYLKKLADRVDSTKTEFEPNVQIRPTINGSFVDSDGYIRISRQEDTPEEWKLPDEEKYRVIYRGILYTGFVYCPNPKCYAKQFKNMVAASRFAQEHRCDKCKAMIEYYFNPQLVQSIRL